MNAVPSVLTTIADPVVAASSLLVWLPAAVLATAAQTDRATGPAPRANAAAARKALVLVRLGLMLAALQATAVVAVASGWVTAKDHAATWPAVVASLTGAGLVVAGARTPLRRLGRGRAVTDPHQLRRLHASVWSAVTAAALAVLSVVLGSGLEPVQDSTGPFLAPTALVAVAVIGVHTALRSSVVAR